MNITAIYSYHFAKARDAVAALTFRNFRRCTNAKLLDEAEGLLARALDSNPKNADVMDAMATFLSQERSS